MKMHIHIIESLTHIKLIKCFQKLLCIITVLFASEMFYGECSSTIPINSEFLKGIDILSKMNPLPPPHPLPSQFTIAEGAVITGTIRGRNLMLVEDASGISVIVTGSGPRYDSKSKINLEEIFHLNVLDVIDILLYEKAPEDVALMRNDIFNFDAMRQINDLNLGQKGKQNISQINISIITKLIQSINERTPSSCLSKTKTLLESFQTLKEKGTLGNAAIQFGKETREALAEFEPLVKYEVAILINSIKQLAEELKPYNAPTFYDSLLQALSTLEKTDTCQIVKQILSQTIKSVAKDIGDIRLLYSLQQYALAHFLHSEQLAYAWLIHKAKNSKNYMYTQRGMCESCNPFMLQAIRGLKDIDHFYVLSSYAANRPSREKDLEIDGTCTLSTTGITYRLIKKPYLPVVRLRLSMDSEENIVSPFIEKEISPDPNLSAMVSYEEEILLSLHNSCIYSAASSSSLPHSLSLHQKSLASSSLLAPCLSASSSSQTATHTSSWSRLLSPPKDDGSSIIQTKTDRGESPLLIPYNPLPHAEMPYYGEFIGE